MTDIQILCFYALEDMTLTELNDKYFNGRGIGYTKRLIAGNVEPHSYIMKLYVDKFEQKYHDKLIKYKNTLESTKFGW